MHTPDITNGQENLLEVLAKELLVWDGINLQVADVPWKGSIFARKSVSAATINCFKVQLDRFWANEEIY